MENKITGIYSATGISGHSGMSWKEEINGIIHFFSEIYIDGKTTKKSDEVEYNGKRIPFAEYLALQRDKKINEILKD